MAGKSIQVDRVQNTSAIGIHRLALRLERHHRLDSFTDADLLSEARSELVQDHEILTVRRRLALQGLQAEWHAEDPAITLQRRMAARQSHGADDFCNPHGLPFLSSIADAHDEPAHGRIL